MVASAIESTEFAEPLLLAQWVDLTVRRRAEQDRADLLLEQAARVQAESVAERLSKLQDLTTALDALDLDGLLPQLATSARRAVRGRGGGGADLRRARPAARRARRPAGRSARIRARAAAEPTTDRWREVPLVIERTTVGYLRLAQPTGRSFSPTERSLLQDAADRAALAIRRAQLHEEEHRIAVELQRGLVPKRLPEGERHRHRRVLRRRRHQRAGRRGLVRRVRDAGRPPRNRRRRRHRAGHPRRVRDGSAAHAHPGVRARQAAATAIRARRSTLLNRHQLEGEDEHLFTIVYAIIDPEQGTIAWANGGHPPPLRRRADGTWVVPRGRQRADGRRGHSYETHEDRTGPNETIVLYTDGLIERRGESLDVGLERLAAAASSGPEDARRMCDHILERVLEEPEQRYDDVTAVVARLFG